ncbi:MAG: hypothetical protein IKT40_09125 [Bacilli bacterium]|nr:hypothetical protein [Bacilli bacterium]
MTEFNYNEWVNNIIISKNKDNFYLLYDEKQYHLLYFQDNKINHSTHKTNDNPSELILIFYTGESTTTLKTLKGSIVPKLTNIDKKMKYDEAESILSTLMDDLANIWDEVKNNDFEKANKRFSDIKEEKIINKINSIVDSTNNNVKSMIRLTEEYVQFKGNNEYRDGLYSYSIHDEKAKSKPVFIGNIYIEQLKVTFDKLKLFKPVVSIKYINTAINMDNEIIRKPYSIVSGQIQEQQMIKTNAIGIEAILRDIYIDGINQNNGIVSAETDLLKDGFFYDKTSGKVISNNVFDNLNSSKKDVQEAVKLLHEVISTRGTAKQNDGTLFRFMLWSPFGYCLKQLGFIDDLYSMVLWGVTDTSKTGSAVIFSYLYADKKTTLQKANTQSAIGSRLTENTFPLILDEAKDNLENPKDEEFNKNIVTDEIGRSVKDRYDNNNIIDFPALRMTVRTLNPDLRNRFKGEFYKRHKVLYYDKSMQINSEDKKAFNKRYNTNSPNTQFNKFKHLGKAFADRFIPYLENQSEELYDLEKLTAKILEDIEKEYNVTFDITLKMKQKLTNQNADVGSIIRNGLNNLLTKVHKKDYAKSTYSKIDFINIVKNGEISWLDYKPNKKLFAIKVSEFEQEISMIAEQHIPILETLSLLDINNAEIIQGKFKGSNIKIVEINTFNLTYKLFDVNIYSKDEWEAWEEKNKTPENKLSDLKNKRDKHEREKNKLDKEIKKLEKEIKTDEAKRKMREEEADRILNAKPI